MKKLLSPMTLFLDCARKIEFSGVLKVVSILCIEPSQFIFFKRLLVATISKCLQYLRCRSNLTHLKIFAVQSRKKGCKQIHKIKQNRFFCGNFCSWFCTVFLQKSVKIWILSRRLGTPIKSKHFRDFFEIF